MDLSALISIVSAVNADPTTVSEINDGPEVIETVIGRNLPKPERAKKVAAPIHEAPKAPSMTAKDFLLTMRKARTRDESIAAIVAYTGLSRNEVSANFGTHDQEARAKAQREINGVNTAGPSRAEKRQAERSVAGFTAGMPDPSQRILLNLQARERATVEALIAAKTEEERSAHRVVLEQVRTAIDQMVG